jgi:hypothetical protein
MNENKVCIDFTEDEELIYDILYGVEIEYIIKISKFIDLKELYKYDRIITYIKDVMKKGDVKILNEKTIKEVNEIYWQILIIRK